MGCLTLENEGARLSWKWSFQRSRHLQGVMDHFPMYMPSLGVTEVKCTLLQMTIISIFHPLLTSSGKPTINRSSLFQHLVYQTSKMNLFQKHFFPCPKFALAVEVYYNDLHALAEGACKMGYRKTVTYNWVELKAIVMPYGTCGWQTYVCQEEEPNVFVKLFIFKLSPMSHLYF